MQDNIMVENGKRWEFDESVTKVFDNMLERSIPQYELMRELVTRIGMQYMYDGATIIDVGCSNGNAVAPFVRRFGCDCRYFLQDCSEPMIKACKEKFGSSIDELQIINHDITKGIIGDNADVILSILTLQFTPIEYRQKIMSSIYDALKVGGVFIFVEKVLGNTNEIDTLMVEQYYQLKSDNQYTQKQIQNKRKSLEGVLVPITARWNEDLLSSVGFKKIDCFWRCLNFAGWIAIK